MTELSDNDFLRVVFQAQTDAAKLLPSDLPGDLYWMNIATAVRNALLKAHRDDMGPGHHVLVTVDEARNNGRASITRSMVPIWSPAGLLRAGDPVEVVREEFDLTEAEAAVIAALVEDFSDLDLGDENAAPPEEDVCRSETVTIDGQPETVRVRGREPMTDLDRSMFGELVAAARAWAAQDEHMAVRQELAAAWMRAAARMPEGPEKTRLRAAVKGAQAALNAHRDHRDGGGHVDIS